MDDDDTDFTPAEEYTHNWRAPLLAALVAPGQAPAVRDTPPSPHEPVDLQQFLTTLTYFTSNDHGTLKVNRSYQDGKLYVKWRWVRGNLAGRAIMAVGQNWQLPYLIAVLYERYVKAVTDGEGTFEDRYYGHERPGAASGRKVGR